jgi:MFS transporter, DHA1 family, tetracycline resistance protein
MRKGSLVIIIGIVFIDMLGVGLAFPILPKLIQHFVGGSFSQASWIFGLISSAYALTQFFLAPVVGGISDRFGRRPVLLLALLGMGINYLAMAVAPSLGWLVAGRLIAGAMGATISTANAYLADITPPEKRAQNFGLVGAAFGFGFITGPALGGYLGDIDIRLPFLFAAGLSFVNLVGAYYVLPESLGLENRKAFSLARANPFGALREIGRFAALPGLLLVFLLATFANQVAPATWVLFTAYRFGWNGTEVGLSLAVVGVIFLVGQGGLVRVIVPLLGERRAILLGLSVSVVTVLSYSLATAGWMLYPPMVLGVFGWITAQPAVMSLMSRAMPQNEQGLLQGAIASVNSLTTIVAPPVWTGVFAYFVSPAAPLIVPGAAFIGAAMVFALALALALRTPSLKPVAAAA